MYLPNFIHNSLQPFHFLLIVAYLHLMHYVYNLFFKHNYHVLKSKRKRAHYITNFIFVKPTKLTYKITIINCKILHRNAKISNKIKEKFHFKTRKILIPLK